MHLVMFVMDATIRPNSPFLILIPEFIVGFILGFAPSILFFYVFFRRKWQRMAAMAIIAINALLMIQLHWTEEQQLMIVIFYNLGFLLGMIMAHIKIPIKKSGDYADIPPSHCL